MVAVGDQQLAGLELGGDRLVDGRVSDPPDAVGRPVRVGDLAPRLAAERRLEVRQASPGWRAKMGERLWRVARVRRSRSSFGPGLGALMGPDPLAVRRETDAGEEAAASEP